MGGGGGALFLSANNVSSSGSGPIGCGHPGATGIPNLSVSGGSGNYSFRWTRVSGTPTYGPWQCSDRNVQNPTWHPPQQVCADAITSAEVWKVEVTDESSGQFGEDSRTVTILWIDTR